MDLQKIIKNIQKNFKENFKNIIIIGLSFYLVYKFYFNKLQENMKNTKKVNWAGKAYQMGSIYDKKRSRMV